MPTITPNINPDTNIAYGVADARIYTSLWGEILTRGLNESMEEAMKCFARSHFDDARYGFADLPEEMQEDFFAEYSDADMGEDRYSWTDDDGNQFGLSSLGGAPLLWVFFSSETAFVRPCSPCIPNAGDLNNPSEFGMECYAVPKEWHDEDEGDD